MEELTPEQQQQLTMATQSSTAVHRYLARFAVPFIDKGASELPIASGTLLNVFGKLLIVTAAHCIPSNPNERLWFLATYPTHSQDKPLAILNHASHADYDAGFIELGWDEATAYFKDKEVCDIQRVQPVGPGREKALVSLVGNPAARVDTTRHHQGLPAWAARIDAYSSVVMSTTEWPAMPAGVRPADNTVDIFLPYPKDLRQLDENTDMEAYHPGGFSGGGIWDQHFSAEGLWSPEKATLFGIQSSWSESGRYLRGVQVVHWLRLVHQHYPAIRPQLEQQFPGMLV